MKIILDETICLKNNLSLQEALIATAVDMGNYENVVSNMQEKQIIDSGGKLAPQWEKIIHKINKTKDEHLWDLAKQMQACFPQGRQPGTAFYYRCNTREVVLKLTKFFEVYGEYSDDQIINATKQFVASYQGEYRFLPLIKYFISKNKKVMDEDGENHVQEVSELASTLENMKDEENLPEMDVSDDWLMNSRN